METDIELPADYKTRAYTLTRVNMFGDEIMDLFASNRVKSMNYTYKYNNHILTTLRIPFKKYEYNYYNNGTLLSYHRMGIYMNYHLNGQLYEYIQDNYPKNDRLQIEWDADGNVIERKKTINGVKVE